MAENRLGLRPIVKARTTKEPTGDHGRLTVASSAVLRQREVYQINILNNDEDKLSDNEPL